MMVMWLGFAPLRRRIIEDSPVLMSNYGHRLNNAQDDGGWHSEFLRMKSIKARRTAGIFFLLW